MKKDTLLDYAIRWLATHETALKTRYFQYCPHQDYEDWTQSVLIYLDQSRANIKLNNPGWMSYVRRAIICRAKNRVRDSIHRVKHEATSKVDMDGLVGEVVCPLTLMDLQMVMGSLNRSTKWYLRGWKWDRIARKTGYSYSRVYTEINQDKRRIRDAIYA